MSYIHFTLLSSYQAINGESSFVQELGDKTDAVVRFFAHLTDDPVRQSIQTAANMILGYAGISKK